MDRDRALLADDRELCWHPYTGLPSDEPRYLVRAADGLHLELADGRRLLDGMSSWWASVLGHRHPRVMQAAHEQLDRLPHVMFGGLTHEPAVELARRLVARSPERLRRVFFCDSGSVSVEVAMKMAIQHFASRGEPQRKRFATLRRGYHGDTWGAMSLCDPDRGMHGLFAGALASQVFAPAPRGTDGSLDDHAGVEKDLAALEAALAPHVAELCAVVLEPIVQGAGGMRFYSPRYLAGVRRWCDENGLLLVCDEIATGFGRTGRYFACEHAGIEPDVACVGKALTGGNLSLAATLTSREVAESITCGDPGVFMHGPTFMANPLACAVANAVLQELDALDWQNRVRAIEAQLRRELGACSRLASVESVRVLGAIGVVELRAAVDLGVVVPMLVERGVWLRPFGKLLYTMPPYVIDESSLSQVTSAMYDVAARL